MFVLPLGTLCADAFVLLGGSMGYTSQNTAAMHPWSATSLGLSEQSYLAMDGSTGLYSAAAIGFIIRSQDNGIMLDPGQYQTLSLNILLGIGYKLSLDRLIGIAGAGLYFGSNTLQAENGTLSSYDAGGVGGGIGASLLYSLAYNWGIGANVQVAYYFMIPSDTNPTMSPTGISIFGGIGVIFFLRSTPDLGSGISRFRTMPGHVPPRAQKKSPSP